MVYLTGANIGAKDGLYGTMSTSKEDFLLFVVCFLLSEVNSGFLDFEELASVNYGIDIVDKPVVIGQEPQGAILLRSKYGQQYQCSYTDWEKEDERERLEQQEAIDTGIPELLRPLMGTCLVYHKDWWTYELCYGKHVKQYHLEDNTVVGNIIYLGHYESEFDWNNITEKDKKRKYHTHTYTNGTICDLTNKPRRVEVRFECDEVGTETISEISEAQTCVYTLIVHTARLCKHPYLKKTVPAKPVPITCNPLISAAQYQEYLNTQQELDRRKEEEHQVTKYRLVSQEGEEHSYVKKYKLIESTEPDQVSDVKVEHDTDLVPSPSQGEGQTGDLEPGSNKEDDNTVEESKSQFSYDEVQNIMADVFTPELKEKVMKVAGIWTDSEDEGQTDDSEKDESQSEGQDSDQEGQELGQDQIKVQGQDVGPDQGQEENVKVEGDAAPVTEVDDVGNDEATQEPALQDEVDDDEKIMAEFDKELNEIVDTAEKKAHMELRGENIESAMNAKFSDIVDEAEDEMAQEGNPVKADRGQAFSDLAKTLTKLLSRLHRTERERRAVEKHLKKAQELAAAARARKHTSRTQDTPDQPTDNTATQDKTVEQAEEVSKQTNDDILSTTQDAPDTAPTEDTVEDTAEDTVEDSDVSTDVKDASDVTDDATDDDGSSLTQLHSLNNRVRVRVTRIKHAGGGGDGGAVAEGAEGEKQTLQLPDEQRKELESTVKSELERAGLETKGQKIEVKIITAGYFDTNKEGMHVLSAEESSAFNNMIISILGGNNQAAREMTHQQRMEEAYTHVWETSDKKHKSSSQPPAPPS